MTMRPAKIFREVSFRKLYGTFDTKIEGINHDSRKVEPGDIFVAIQGENVDGHEYIGQALKKGAALVVGERNYSDLDFQPPRYVQAQDSREALSKLSDAFFDHPSQKLFAVGITGTNGKTTTAHLVSEVLGREKTALISTINNPQRSGEKGPVTTPEAPVLHRRAARALNSGKKNFVMEVSSHSLAFKRVSTIEFNCGIFTNLTRDHLDYHQTLEDYKATKLRLFENLPDHGFALINADEKFSSSFKRASKGKVLTYAIDEPADLRGVDIQKTPGKLEFSVKGKSLNLRIELGLLGSFNVYNALAAVGVGLVKGLEPDEIEARLRSHDSLPGRMERFQLPNGADAVVDFAHNPGALKTALKELRQHYGGVYVVFGCGGDSDKGKRPLMGKFASRHADYSVITNDNPKGEDPKEITDQIREGFDSHSSFDVIRDRSTAIKKAASRAGAGDVILVAGKGHERYQIIDGQWLEYSDRQVLVEELGASQ
ncbi:MAG: UDP-N-acetylmuramoyl-L-alanyl-D-glutamate--2,6-diaminopimelate ligase [Candidatus Bipolaricaulota bacterium]